MNEEIVLNVFAKRLSQLIEENNTDIPNLVSQLGLKSKSTIYRYINAQMSPKITTVKYLAELYNVNPIWLMGYDVPKNNDRTTKISNAIEVVKIPVLGKISAGVPIMAEESFEGYALAPATQIKSDKEYFYLRVQGDSMNLKCPEGSIVLVERTNYLDNGDIGVIAINGYNATIKRFKKESNLIILEPMSTNPEHTVQIYNTKEIEIHILGKAISFKGNI